MYLLLFKQKKRYVIQQIHKKGLYVKPEEEGGEYACCTQGDRALVIDKK